MRQPTRRGSIRVELFRTGQTALADEQDYVIVLPPKPKERDDKARIPPFRLIPVEGPEDPNWAFISEDSLDARRFASAAVFNQSVLHIYYSRAVPRFAGEFKRMEQQGTGLASTFETRYKLWLAVHAIMLHQQREEQPADMADDDVLGEFDRQERCRLATVAAMVAAQEARLEAKGSPLEDEVA
jgi:hypothetical protein